MLIIGFPSQPHRAVRGAGFLREGRQARAPARHLRGPRPRLCRHHLRRLEGALDHAGARRPRRRRGVLHHVEELQHGGLAHRLHGRQPGPGARARPHQELPRLRHLYSAAGGRHHRAGRAAGVRGRDRRQVPDAPRRDGEGPARGRLDGGEPEGLDVRLGADPGEVPRRRARSSLPSDCCARPRSRCRRASASGITATIMCASR